ncbi:UvrD-helicase domain-containing protein [Faecalimonas sp.]
MVEKGLKNNDKLNEILNHIREGHNFLLSGGAGSGKTYSLVEVLQNVAIEYPSAEIACITYTNVAALEIKNRASIKNLRVSTIHDFLWDMIYKFQKEAKKTLLELINDSTIKVQNMPINGDYTNEFENGIQYKEYVRIDRGEISHDEVLILANRMYSKYPKLCDLLLDKYQFIFVDEYQDTSPLVVEILLKFLQNRVKKNIIGFFGDSMQSIYDSGVGDISEYIERKTVYKVEKRQNRRNPQSIIELSNVIRTDGLVQEPSKDETAPNMKSGKVKQGTVKFLYSKDFNLELAKASDILKSWDFTDSKETKELRLTHNLIANEAGFVKLMSVYDQDPIVKFKQALKNEINKKAQNEDFVICEEESFDNVVNALNWKYERGEHKGKTHLEVLLEDENAKVLYDYVKNWPYQKVRKIYFDKDNLIDDNTDFNGVTRDSKRDFLIRHLFKIQNIISLYDSKNYHELIKIISFPICSILDKKNLKENIDGLKEQTTGTIESVIKYANENHLCVVDDKLERFINNNEYLYWRVKNIEYSEFQKLYEYLEGYMPFSTQHKIKGLEFNNVLLVLHNGGWNKYNFEYLFDSDIEETLSASKKKSFSKILNRTKKLFYVCCTRAKENLVIYYPCPSTNVIKTAEDFFGKDNCIDLDYKKE